MPPLPLTTITTNYDGEQRSYKTMTTNLEALLELPTPAPQIKYEGTQALAIEECCDISKRIVAVSGEAGTGKTLLIKEIYRRLSDAGYLVACCAPTGKAAKRIRESTGLLAVTNHRLLGYGMPIDHEETDELTGNKMKVKISTGPSFNRKRPLPYDFILCDEYAMVNREIHDALISALKPGARIRMFGDTNQLKPIEEDKTNAARPSAFMTALDKFTGVVLDVNYRQDAGSGVVANAKRILVGRTPNKAADFEIIYTGEPVMRLLQYVTQQKEEGVDYSTLDNQIITCMNKSWIGTKRLNLSLQTLWWDRQAPYLELPRNKWEGEETIIRVQLGSKVVYTANTYDLGNEQSVFNGETGIVVNIDEHEGSIDVDFGDRVCTIPPLLIVVNQRGDVVEQDPRKNVDLAGVLTTHKMQGSEVKNVTYIINKSTTYGQSRRNFYTAVSRARNKCTVITDQHSMKKSTVWAG
jgi:exodeoxyribonuclease V alpha subunit